MLNGMILPIPRRKLKFPLLSKKKPIVTTSTPKLIKIRPKQQRTTSPQCSRQMTTSKFVAGQRAKARDIVACLQEKNIQLIAIDFDKTLLEIHTRGRYQGKLDDLLDSFRSTFHYLIDEILQSPHFGQTLHLCIVSFSSQDVLIRQLLEIAFPHSKTDSILIRCNTKDFLNEFRSSVFVGKELHLTSIIREIECKRGKIIEAHRIVLFDDDVKNILIAQEFDHHALQIDDDVNLDILKEFVFDINSSEKI